MKLRLRMCEAEPCLKCSHTNGAEPRLSRRSCPGYKKIFCLADWLHRLQPMPPRGAAPSTFAQLLMACVSPVGVFATCGEEPRVVCESGVARFSFFESTTTEKSRRIQGEEQQSDTLGLNCHSTLLHPKTSSFCHPLLHDFYLLHVYLNVFKEGGGKLGNF